MEFEAEYIYDKMIIYDDYNNLKFNYLYIMELSDYKKIGYTKIHHKELKHHASSGINCLIEMFRFEYKNNIYICFHVVSNIMVSSDYPILKFAYKLHNSYIISKNDPFRDIKNIVYRQGIERSHVGLNCISTTHLLELVANKVEYSLFLKERGLMDNTKVTIPGYKLKNKHIKIPYTKPTPYGIRYLDGLENFHSEELVVVQNINKIAINHEFRCYCIDGKIDFAIIKEHGNKSDNKYICINSELDSNDNDSNICKIIKEHKKHIHDICEKTFDAMNRLVHYRLLKLKYEIDSANFIINNVADSNSKITDADKKAMLHTLLSLSNNRKKILIAYINGNYNKSIDPETFTIPVMDYSVKEDIYPIYDHFMRIDIALPDGDNYDKVTVSNIEVFEDDKIKFKVIKDVVQTNGNYFNKIYQYILYKIISNNPKKFTRLV